MQFTPAMSLLAAVLHFAGDEETAAAFEEPVFVDPTEWTPSYWSRKAANDDGSDVLIPAREAYEFHSTDSGLAWSPKRVG